MRSLLLCLSICLALLLISAQSSDDLFQGENQETGFIPVNNGNQLFYWLFRSRSNPTTDPLVIWLTGGPGCSGELSLFYENGPFHIQEDLTLIKNENSWNNIANMVWIDQPVGTGFSDSSTYDSNSTQFSSDFYVFLTGFLSQYPEFNKRPLYLAGESYGGHFVPDIAAYMLTQANPNLNLRGISIGDGLVDPYLQYPSYAPYSYQAGLIGEDEYNILQLAFSGCQALITAGGSGNVALDQCDMATDVILGSNPFEPNFNFYNYKKPCYDPPLCYNFTLVQEFLAQPNVMSAIGVEGKTWTACSTPVQSALMGDFMVNSTSNVVFLLNAGVFVNVYNGELDWIIDWMGSEAWVNSIPWNGQKDFKNQKYQNWGYSAANIYGQIKKTKNLVFAKVLNAGHLVPMDQPTAALYLFQNFLNNWQILN
jgi:cathepsin A (carboxypeptidase C)